MLQAAISALILLGIYKFLDRNRTPEDFDPKVDWWMAFAFIFAPSILLLLLNMLLGILSLNPLLILVGYILYFIVPFAVLKGMLDFQTKRAVMFSIFVPIVAITTEVIYFIVLPTPTA